MWGGGHDVAPSMRMAFAMVGRCRTTPAASRHGINDIFGRIVSRLQFGLHVTAKSSFISKGFLHRPAPVVGASAFAAFANMRPPASPPVLPTNLADPVIVAATQLAVHDCPNLDY